MYYKMDRVWMAADGGGGGGQPATQQDNADNTAQGNETLTFEAWFEGQNEQVRGLLNSHTNGLKSALSSERESRKELEKQLRDLAKKAESGSQAQDELTRLADQVSAETRKAAFYEAAHTAGVTNLKLAYLAATQDNLLDEKGNVDFAAMRTTYPQLFGTVARVNGNAGSGTQSNAPKGSTMNDFIRAAAGRK